MRPRNPTIVHFHLKFPPEQNPNRGIDIWGSCDGLLLILDICFSCILVNPSTRQCRKLPKSSFSKSKFHLNSYGLGHDPSNDDYKVVRISNHDQDANCADNKVSVYTLRMNLWSRVEDSPYDHIVHGPSRGILVGGALHWLARKGVGSNKSTVIVSFDLADENFRDMDSVDNFILVEELGVLGGCLCVLVPDYGFCDDVWVMKEYGMRDSWIKFTVNCNNFCKPLCLSTAGEVLLEVNQRKLVLFNPQERESKELVIQGSPYRFEAGIYMESLVSPNFSNINDHEGSRVPQARPEACDDSKTEAESSMTTTFRLDESSNPPSPRFSPFD
ncbi:hypothetical protein ACSBR1_041741 [Camellia fascicularis]